MRTPPVVALLTDFGTRDPFVGVMHGVVLGRCPDARIVDLTHDVAPQGVAEGAFWLERSARWFPEGTVFVAVVDPGVGTDRRAVAAVAHGHFFVGPDNGLLCPAVSADPGAIAYRIDVAALALPVPSRTFHGRDVFAPVAGELAARRLSPDAVGPKMDLLPGGAPVASRGPDGVEGAVITVDRFGNLITNVSADAVRALGEVVVEAGAHRLPLSRTYADVAPGDLLALVNAFDVVEIARRDGDAAACTGFGRGARVLVRSK